MAWFVRYLYLLVAAVDRAFYGSDQEYEAARLALNQHRRLVPWWPL